MTLIHRRRFTREFKLQVLAEIAAGISLDHTARELQLHPTLFGRWQNRHPLFQDPAFARNGRSYTHEARIADLERMLGPLTMEYVLLKIALYRLDTLSHPTTTNAGK